MKVRNTTDFDTRALRSWLRRVVRHVEAALVKGHPLGWPEQAVRARATLILTHCDVWVRQTRRDQSAIALQAHAGWLGRAEKQRALGNERSAQVAEENAERWILDGGTGRAAYSGRRLRMTLHGGDLVSLLWLARHETWHLFGVRHEHFPDSVMRETASSRVAVALLFGVTEGATLPRTPPEPKSVPSVEDRASAKLLRLTEREKAWRTKLKRAETALAKIRKSKRYYAKQIAVAAASAQKMPPR